MSRPTAPAADGESAAAPLVLEISSEDIQLWQHTQAATRHAPVPQSAAFAASESGTLNEAANVLQSKLDTAAQQLGQAIAQRLQAQIQRGHWQLSVHLHPQELGSIDVQLGMRGGDLVASFQAAAVLTRELLQEQMPRLREMLADAGIDVASTHVGAHSGGRSGGNPTPSSPQGAGGTDAPQSTAEAPASALNLRDDGGLDVWA